MDSSIVSGGVGVFEFGCSSVGIDEVVVSERSLEKGCKFDNSRPS